MVKQGYKQTEVGLIPEEWDIKCAESFGDIITGSTPSTENARFWNGDTPWITPSDIQEARDIAKSERMITKEGLSAIRELPPSTLLVTCIASIGKNAVLTQKGACNQQINAIIPSNEYSVNYLYYLMEINKEYLLANSGITATRIVSKNDFAKLKFAVSTNKKEQEYIAEALSDVDSMISSLEKLIAKKKAVKQGAMQELLTGKKRLPGFEGDWKPIQLGSVSKIKTGDKNNEQKTDDGRYPFFVRSQQVERINSYSYDGEAILIPGEGNIGQIFHYINGKFDWHQRVYKISDFSEFVCGKYVYYQMKFSFGEHALKNTVKATVDSLRLPTFEQFEFLISPIVEEQTAIASILSDIDNEIEALEQKLEKTRQIKQGMMQQLLTGKIRLVLESADNKPIEAVSKPHHNHQFDDAVMIAAIVNEFYDDTIPLGRKKVQKLLYLLRRKQEADTSAFKKKAAGPYADEVRYKGGEPIAIRSQYVAKKQGTKGTTFSKGEKIESALEYIKKWEMTEDIKWLASTFKYTKTIDLELFATIDMAMCDLINSGVSISVESIKKLIASNKEWKDKLSKAYFSDNDITRAIRFCQCTFN